MARAAQWPETRNVWQQVEKLYSSSPSTKTALQWVSIRCVVATPIGNRQPECPLAERTLEHSLYCRHASNGLCKNAGRRRSFLEGEDGAVVVVVDQ